MRCLILIFFTVCAMTAHANSLERIGLPNLILLGEGRLGVLFWDIYDARLYVADGSYDPEKPFALSLNYLRGFSGSDITKRSIEEIRKQGLGDESVLASWRTMLSKIFPDVVEGDEIIGVSDPSEGARFFLNDLLIGTITDQNLSRRFFDIWLSEKTSEPEIRKLLMRIGR
jgi:hypothetical protein